MLSLQVSVYLNVWEYKHIKISVNIEINEILENSCADNFGCL